MPLYFANQRHNIVKKGYGQTGRKEYMRSSPTRAIILQDSQPNWVVSMLYCWMHAIFQSYWDPVADEDRDDSPWGTELKGFFPTELKLQDCLPFPMPKIAVCFSSNNIPVRVLEKIEEMGFTLQAMKNVKTPVYTKDYPTLEEAGRLMTIPGVNADFVPPYDYITPDAIGPLFKLLVGLSAIIRVSGTLFNSAHNVSHFLKMSLVGENGATVGLDEEMEEGEVDEDEDRIVRAPKDAKNISFTDTIHFDVDRARVNGSNYTPWGKIEDRAIRKPGIFCPFEPNYSQPDVDAIMTLFSKFDRCFYIDEEEAVKSIEGIAYYWAREIATTSVGERIAHVIKGLDIAQQTGSSIYPIFRPGGHYDGLIINGFGLKLRKLGEGVVKSLGADDLNAEMAEFGFHGILLEKIVAACGIVAPLESITTMRRLRTLVMAGGMPSGTVKNEVSKYLSRLAFVEKPEGINASSMEKIFNILSTQDEIPDELYLHWEDFWSENRTVLVLSCWGRLVPSFLSGPTKVMACHTRGKNAAGAKEYSNMKPAIFQVKQKPIAVAKTEWESMMQGGWIMTPKDSRLQGGRVFRAQEGTHLWGKLCVFLTKTVNEYNASVRETVEEEASRQGKKRRPDGGEDGRNAKRQELDFGGIELGSWD